jgi:hypothetical protein
MNQALQDVIEHRRTTNVFKPMRAARGLFRLGRASRPQRQLCLNPNCQESL